jgi:hypothetical protein
MILTSSLRPKRKIAAILEFFNDMNHDGIVRWIGRMPAYVQKVRTAVILKISLGVFHTIFALAIIHHPLCCARRSRVV